MNNLTTLSPWAFYFVTDLLWSHYGLESVVVYMTELLCFTFIWLLLICIHTQVVMWPKCQLDSITAWRWPQTHRCSPGAPTPTVSWASWRIWFLPWGLRYYKVAPVERRKKQCWLGSTDGNCCCDWYSNWKRGKKYKLISGIHTGHHHV